MKKVLLVGMLTLAIVVLLVIGIGYVLPRDHTATSEIQLGASADSVWSVVRTLDAYPDWWSHVSRMERVGRTDREVWHQIDRTGTTPLEIVREEPGRVLVARILDEGLPFGGTWTYEVLAERDGARVRVTENGSVYNPVFRFMARFEFGHHATMDSYLRAMAERFGDVAAEPMHAR